jgi:hypothetical protein
LPAFGFAGNKPEGLSIFSKEVFDVVARYTAFPWPIISAQCRRANVDPVNLDGEGLRKVLDFIAEGVGYFTSPEKAMLVRRELALLARV